MIFPKILLILLTCISNYGYSQSLDLKGNVKTEEFKRGIKKTKIILFQNQNPLDSTLTDKSGNFSFTNLGEGMYKLKIIKKKYFEKELEGIAIKNETVQLEDIFLQKYIKL